VEAAASLAITVGSLGAACWLCFVAALALVYDVRGVPEAGGEAGEAMVPGGDRVDQAGHVADLAGELVGQLERREDLSAGAEPSEWHAAPIDHDAPPFPTFSGVPCDNPRCSLCHLVVRSGSAPGA
jgi:hypothetical protein